MDAWLDLANDRQRIAGQLVQSLEGALVLLAGTQQSSQAAPTKQPTGAFPASGSDAAPDQQPFVKLTERAYATIRSAALPAATNQSTGGQLELSFPSESSTLGTGWMDAEQRFTLRLQSSSSGNSPAAADQQQAELQQAGKCHTNNSILVVLTSTCYLLLAKLKSRLKLALTVSHTVDRSPNGHHFRVVQAAAVARPLADNNRALVFY